MNQDLTVEIIGYLAAFCTTLAYLPQAILVHRTNKTDGISIYMFLILCFGLFCWFLYGVMLMKWPIISANFCTVLLSGYILMKKIGHVRSRKSKK